MQEGGLYGAGMKFRMKRRVSPTDDRSVAQSTGGGAISSRKKKGQLTVGGRIALGLFFSVFLATGLGATYALAVKPWMQVWKARSWTPVSCVILSSEVKTNHGSDSTTYSVAIAYAYDVNGRTYEGNRYDFTTGSSSGRKAKRAIVERYREGRETMCYVNPENPAESVIERGRVRDWGFGLIPLVFVLVGAGGVTFAIRGQRKPGEDVQTRGGGGRGNAFTAPAAVQADDLLTEDSGGGGQVELKPAESRVGKLVAVTVFALFWNGIVSVFVVNIIGDALRGAGIMWLFLLFLLPFIGIGLFMIGLAVRQAMSLANPVPRLTVNRGAFSPGETVELAWRFEGKAERLKNVRLFLEGREEATYRRGTDTKTDREVFATFDIAAASGLSAGEPAQARLKLPARLMHSFKTDNNRVRWSLRMKGDVAWWPDVDEEFEFLIVPAARQAAPLSTPPRSES
jgi:hypothetical protein